MIHGNQQSQRQLQEYITTYAKSEAIPFPFLLLVWPAHIGKTTLVESLVDQLLGAYRGYDYLPLYDYSTHIGKQHTIKVDLTREQKTLEWSQGEKYQDTWVRELISRLTMGASGDIKITYLENIERMTREAANAFLKTAEEPLPGRLIIASTANEDMVIETLRSRAYIIRFQLPTGEEVKQYIHAHYAHIADQIPEMQMQHIHLMCAGRIGILKHHLDKPENHLATWPIWESVTKFGAIVDHMMGTQQQSAVQIARYLQDVAQLIGRSLLLEALMCTADERQAWDRIDTLMLSVQMLRSNISQENVAYALAFDL